MSRPMRLKRFVSGFDVTNRHAVSLASLQTLDEIPHRIQDAFAVVI